MAAEIREAIMGHAQYSGVARTTHLAKALFACDELAGFLTAVSLVKPTKSIFDVDVASVRKKMKDKAFARGVHREDIISGAQELRVELDAHIAFCIAAMRSPRRGPRPLWCDGLVPSSVNLISPLIRIEQAGSIRLPWGYEGGTASNGNYNCAVIDPESSLLSLRPRSRILFGHSPTHERWGEWPACDSRKQISLPDACDKRS